MEPVIARVTMNTASRLAPWTDATSGSHQPRWAKTQTKKMDSATKNTSSNMPCRAKPALRDSFGSMIPFLSLYTRGSRVQA